MQQPFLQLCGQVVSISVDGYLGCFLAISDKASIDTSCVRPIGAHDSYLSWVITYSRFSGLNMNITVLNVIKSHFLCLVVGTKKQHFINFITSVTLILVTVELNFIRVSNNIAYVLICDWRCVCFSSETSLTQFWSYVLIYKGSQIVPECLVYLVIQVFLMTYLYLFSCIL